MITDHDRSWWFGASDVSFIMGNYGTATFKKWWLEKLGLRTNRFTTKAMNAGTNYEHKILDSILVYKKDRQIQIPELRLRVNLDGETENKIHEVKTYSSDVFKLTNAYKNQVRVQMYASGIKNAEIVAYQLTEADYKNYFNNIDPTRLSFHQIAYDEDFVKLFVGRLKYLCECLEKGAMPKCARRP